MTWCTAGMVFAIALTCVAGQTAAVDYRIFPGLAKMDGHYNALTVARDGKVYIGLARHGAAGHVVRYDPATDAMIDLGDLNRFSGQSGLRIGPQSKVHAPFGEAADGRLYFATHGGDWWDFSRFATVDAYPGGHWMVYDPRTGTTTDLGIGARFEGIITAEYDPVHERMYGLTYPRGHFIYHDIRTGTTHDKGRVNNLESVGRSIGVDDEGNVYGAFGKGQIFKFDFRADELTELPLYLPIRQKGVALGRDYTKSETGWRMILWHKAHRKFYGIEESAGVLFSFDPYAGEYGSVTTLGQLVAPGGEERRNIPYPSLGLTLGIDDKLYYAAPSREFDFALTKDTGISRLLVWDLKSGSLKDRGEIRLPDGRGLMGAGSAATAPDGTIYFVGAIEARAEAGEPLEYGGMIQSTPYRLALIIYRPDE